MNYHHRTGLPMDGCRASNAIKGKHERDAYGLCQLCGDGPGAIMRATPPSPSTASSPVQLPPGARVNSNLVLSGEAPSTTSEVGELPPLPSLPETLQNAMVDYRLAPQNDRASKAAVILAIQAYAESYARAALAAKPAVREAKPEVLTIPTAIMSIGCNSARGDEYKLGHRDARHAAADLVLARADELAALADAKPAARAVEFLPPLQRLTVEEITIAAVKALTTVVHPNCTPKESHLLNSGFLNGVKFAAEHASRSGLLKDAANEARPSSGEVDVEAERKLMLAAEPEFAGLSEPHQWHTLQGWLAARRTQEGAKDAERLDWIARHGAALRSGPNDGRWYLDVPYHTGISSVDYYHRFDSARAAIDAAIAATQTKESPN